MTEKTLAEKITEFLPEATRRNVTLSGAALFGVYALSHVV